MYSDKQRQKLITMIFNSSEESFPALFDICNGLVVKLSEFCKTNNTCIEYLKNSKMKCDVAKKFYEKKHLPGGKWVDWHYEILRNYIKCITYGPDRTPLYGFELLHDYDPECNDSYGIERVSYCYTNDPSDPQHKPILDAHYEQRSCPSYSKYNRFHNTTDYIGIRPNPLSNMFYFYLVINLWFDSSDMDNLLAFNVYVEPFLEFARDNGILIDCIMPETVVDLEKKCHAKILFIPNIRNVCQPKGIVWPSRGIFSNDGDGTHRKIAILPEQQHDILDKYKEQVSYKIITSGLHFMRIIKYWLFETKCTTFNKSISELYKTYGNRIDILCYIDQSGLFSTEEHVMMIEHRLAIDKNLDYFKGSESVMLEKINNEYSSFGVDFRALGIIGNKSNHHISLAIIPTVNFFIEYFQGSLCTNIPKLKALVKKVMFADNYIIPEELLYTILMFM